MLLLLLLLIDSACCCWLMTLALLLLARLLLVLMREGVRGNRGCTRSDEGAPSVDQHMPHASWDNLR